MKPLILNLKTEYFNAIKDGTKPEEFRLFSDYWTKRLLDNKGEFKTFSKIIIRRGYPKSGDPEREIIRPWVSNRIDIITHPHFNNEPSKVFCIRVN